MAVTPPTTITETFVDPATGAVSKGKVSFTLNKNDFDDAVIVAQTIEADIQPDGTISIALWPNTAGIALSSYDVRLNGQALGSIVVPQSTAPMDLGDMIAVPGIGILKTIEVMSLPQFDALAVKDPSTLYLIRS